MSGAALISVLELSRAHDEELGLYCSWRAVESVSNARMDWINKSRNKFFVPARLCFHRLCLPTQHNNEDSCPGNTGAPIPELPVQADTKLITVSELTFQS